VEGGTLGGIPGGVATKREATEAEDVAKKPIDAVRGQALYDPNPDEKKLAGTKAFTFDKRGGQSHVSFCVNASGKVEDVRTVKKFPGDPKVDEICRDAVKAWRFKPFLVDGKAKKTCSVVKFDLKPD
jgi:protein TonB